MSRRTLRRAAVVAACAAVVAGLALPASAAQPDRANVNQRSQSVASVASVATATASVIPADCGVIFHRATAGALYYGTVVGGRAGAGTVGALTFGSSTETPVAMAYVRTLSTAPQSEQYIATLADGSLWEVLAPLASDAVTTRMISTGGWGAMRELVTGDSSYIYGLTTSGGLYRYTLSTGGVIRSAGSIATGGWGGVRSLTWAGGGTFYGGKVDSLVALSASGALMEYLIRTDTRAPRGFVLRSSGWGGFQRISVGACTKSSSRPISGVTPLGDLYAYLDTNGFNLTGSDIRGAGKVGHGFVGLLFD
ncbi:hypothetical protein [Phycicoccus sp.]|uniref:hypothetical protein n=1 Tax=Phycicoccus sp. TaxID=1902410 RepID=UPI002BC19292|nr:hypothetical protein [Phycicoccus sp.]HMM97349.1 hypothetical protein [Phycicoccus sp.]